MPDIVTPKILQNVPVGKDEFASQSQEHIAESIKNLILNIDNEKTPIRLIGIEGGWGTGKSNLVKILEKKLKGKGYSFFFMMLGDIKKIYIDVLSLKNFQILLIRKIFVVRVIS